MTSVDRRHIRLWAPAVLAAGPGHPLYFRLIRPSGGPSTLAGRGKHAGCVLGRAAPRGPAGASGETGLWWRFSSRARSSRYCCARTRHGRPWSSASASSWQRACWGGARALAAVAVAFGALLAFDIASIVAVDATGLQSIAGVLVLPYALLRWGTGREAALRLGIILIWLPVTLIAVPTTPAERVAGYGFFLFSAALGAAVRYRTSSRVREIEQVRLRQRNELARASAGALSSSLTDAVNRAASPAAPSQRHLAGLYAERARAPGPGERLLSQADNVTEAIAGSRCAPITTPARGARGPGRY
jgi:hypothetical protein